MRSVNFLKPIARMFGEKPRLWAEGRRNLLKQTEELFRDKKEDIIWFHCASLGEFEQGRELIEEIRKKYPTYKILLTFYSPSGYEPRKNYAGADYISYLPIDTPCAARRFVRAVNPKIVIFVKYEFWTNMLRECRRVGAKLYVVSAIFNPKQMFFKWWGKQGIRTLRLFDHIFVQNSESVELLKKIGITDVTVAGDTRFDRVYSLALGAKVVEQMESFADTQRPIFVAGSTWPPDDTIILDAISHFPNLKFVIVPHELPRQKIDSLVERCTKLGKKTVCYSENRDAETIKSADVIIIDTIGILSSTYRYATIAYIGGGFGVGIHNTLEAATYGLPIAFGTNYDRFKEAKDLISLGAAHSVCDSKELNLWIKKLLDDPQYLSECKKKSESYVQSKIGASSIILNHIERDIKVSL